MAEVFYTERHHPGGRSFCRWSGTILVAKVLVNGAQPSWWPKFLLTERNHPSGR